MMNYKLMKQFFRTLTICPLYHSLKMVSEYKKLKSNENFSELGSEAI